MYFQYIFIIGNTILYSPGVANKHDPKSQRHQQPKAIIGNTTTYNIYQVIPRVYSLKWY